MAAEEIVGLGSSSRIDAADQPAWRRCISD